MDSANRARRWGRLHGFGGNRLACAGLGWLLLFVGLALIWPWLGGSSPTALSDAQFVEPGSQYWFGTDVHGRDLFARVLYGARVSLLVGSVGAVVSLCLGSVWGALAGYLGGRWDAVLMRAVDVLYALPSIVLVIVLVSTIEPWIERRLGAAANGGGGAERGATGRMLLLFLGLGAVSWLTMARIVRGQVLSLRARAFVEASRALGASHARILARHVLPNTAGIIVVYLALTVPSIILYESFLSFLGLGIQPPHASLGSLLADGAAQINPIRVYWWLIVFPGVTLTFTLLALNLVADGLRDALEPRTRHLYSTPAQT
jgi:peptide/nickel transport system permease protein/oligopeptide transport system permease protein